MVEAAVVADGARIRGGHRLDALVREANLDFGRGSGHPAQLNFGDCFSYALASITGEPLLYKGDDFRHTDVRSALG